MIEFFSVSFNTCPFDSHREEKRIRNFHGNVQVFPRTELNSTPTAFSLFFQVATPNPIFYNAILRPIFPWLRRSDIFRRKNFPSIRLNSPIFYRAQP